MHKLRMMSWRGHQEVTWDPEAVAAGDPEALAAVAQAEQIVATAVARGQAVFRVDAPDQPAKRLEQFDPAAKQTLIIPRVAGGSGERRYVLPISGSS